MIIVKKRDHILLIYLYDMVYAWILVKEDGFYVNILENNVNKTLSLQYILYV
jgi:hypothetical protein